MKIIYLFILIVTLNLQLSAQDSLQELGKKIDTVVDSIGAIKTRLNAIDTTVKSVKDTVRDLVNEKLIIDVSALDSAMKFPEQVLYQSYLFGKKTKEGIRWFFAIFALIILILMWILCIRYTKSDSLCKDTSFYRSGKRIAPKECPYSYARTQLLWWTMIIFSCYIFFFGVTGVLLPLNVTSVLLLGFGAIVYGTGKIIDDRQIAEAKGTRNQDLGGQNKDSPDFIKDILSDDNGISIHRFQAVVFNVVFGVGYIAFFIKSLIHHKYPLVDFTEWQFALIGISSATYLSLKATENSDYENKSTKRSQALNTLDNENFPRNDNLSIEYHDDSQISNQPPAEPPPNIK